MQFKQLRYFVAVVEAGSISRAASVVHIAQPALSQQIADLEERIGIQLLLRTPRGVKPTSAGETFFREASLILHRMDQLPGMLKSAIGDIQGTVRVGIVASLAGPLVGVIIEHFKAELPKVNLVCSDGDSGSLIANIQSHALDLALVYEDELGSLHSRTPIFAQQLYLIGQDAAKFTKPHVSLEDLVDIPLVSPSRQRNRRTLIERAFAARNLTPKIVAELDNLSSELSAVRAGVGNTILNVGELPVSLEGLPDPIPIKPPLFMTCCAIFNNDAALSAASEAVRTSLIKIVRDFIRTGKRRGAKVIS
jgi:LysR family transcriptional regulator, nitrogen assimilation regulatory protein